MKNEDQFSTAEDQNAMPVPAGCEAMVLTKTNWISTDIKPSYTGQYELLTQLAGDNPMQRKLQVVVMHWSGKVWVNHLGAAVDKGLINGAHWRGLTVPSYTRACFMVDIDPARIQDERRTQKDRRNNEAAEVNKPQRSPGRRSEDFDLDHLPHLYSDSSPVFAKGSVV